MTPGRKPTEPFKSGIRAIFQLPTSTPSSPLLLRLGFAPLANLYKSKLLVFVHRCINQQISILFDPFFAPVANQRSTRGQMQRLLQVPFIRGPAGRSSVQFVGTVLWNQLPGPTRLIVQKSQFQKALTSEVITNLSIV